uniref:Uncharacterized protein n=1 Tax=Macrostomum lignano TaxID=282301 RepID=A0A1I8FZ14_9PLAT
MSAVSLPSAAACARSDSLDLSNSSNEAIPNSDIEVASSLGGTSDREFSIGESWRTVDDGSSRDSQSRPDDRVPALTPRTLIESNSPATTANGTVVAESVTDVFAEAVPTALIPEEKHPDKPEAEKTGAELPLRPRKRWRPRRRQPPVSSSRTAAGVPESAALTMPNSAATASESPVQRTVSELRSLALVGDAKLQHRTAIKEEQQQRNSSWLSATRTTTATAARQWKTRTTAELTGFAGPATIQPLPLSELPKLTREAVTATKAAAAA